MAPAGAPIRISDLLRAAGVALAGRDSAAAVRREINGRFSVQHSFLTSTGRAGMTLLLRALAMVAASPARNEVVLPAYTCYSVAASVVKAGLRPRLIDISPETLDFDRQQLVALDFSRVLAIVATNLYGLPNDLPWLSGIARENHVFLIDDAAQCMGAIVGGQPSGTWGDAGLYSFDKGKNVSAIDGGVVVTNSDRIADALTTELRGLPSPSIGETCTAAVKAAAYSVLLHPSLYWIPNRIPQLSLGKTVFTTEFPLERPIPGLTALAATMMPRLDAFTAARVANAAALESALRSVAGVRTITPLSGTKPVYLRFPVLVRDAASQTRAIESLNAAGIGATGSYPESLADVPELRPHLAEQTPCVPGARDVARRIVTLPTHSFVSPSDVTRAAAVLAALDNAHAEFADARGTASA